MKIRVKELNFKTAKRVYVPQVRYFFIWFSLDINEKLCFFIRKKCFSESFKESKRRLNVYLMNKKRLKFKEWLTKKHNNINV